MNYEVLEQKLKCIPDEYTDMVSSMLDSVIQIINLQQSETKKAYRQLGLLKGQIKISDDFDETPDCFKEYV